MNESFLIRFTSNGRPLNVVEFDADQGLTFDHHPDASPLNMAIGVLPLLPGLLDGVRQKHDWRDKEFMLDAAAVNGGLRFSGFEGDPTGLPAGAYDLSIEVESYQFRNNQPRLILHTAQAAEITLDEAPDRRRVKVRDNIDSMTSAVIGEARSVVDGAPLMQWLTSPDPRPARQACLLNILAKLRVPPDPTHGLATPITSALEFIFFGEVDRVYAAARPDIRNRLDQLVQSGLWKLEGRPIAAIHGRLLEAMSRIGVPDASRFELKSFRQGGRNCLQIVVASPPAGSADPTLYADIDIDLGNPLWDLEGLIVHIGELLDSGKTDHLALRSKLASGPTSDFLYYDIIQV